MYNVLSDEDPGWHQIAKILTEWSFFTELAVQAIFIALLIIATHLFKELDDRLEKLNGDAHAWIKWKRHYDLVRTFVDQINAVFGLILLATFSHVFMDMTYYSQELMLSLRYPSDYSISLILDRSLLYFGQVFSRLLLITFFAWNMTTNQVSIMHNVRTIAKHLTR